MAHSELKISMELLVQTLREILANMEEEQYALLIQDAATFSVIMNNRKPLITKMQSLRSTMVEEIDKLNVNPTRILEIETERDRLMHLALLAGEENVEILVLRDQVLALTEQMEKQNTRNNFLLDNQISESNSENISEKYSHPYKPVRRRIQLKKAPQTKPKVYVQTLEMNEISEEV